MLDLGKRGGLGVPFRGCRARDGPANRYVRVVPSDAALGLGSVVGRADLVADVGNFAQNTEPVSEPDVARAPKSAIANSAGPPAAALKRKSAIGPFMPGAPM